MSDASDQLKMDMRAVRAKQFASQIMSLLADYLPRDREINERIYDELGKAAYEANALIVNLPPEFDELSEAAAQRAMLDKMLKPLIITAPPPD